VPSYASPVRATLAGVDQVLAVEENYLTAYATADGQQLWQVDWPSSSSGAAACSQPVPLSGDRVLLTKGYGTGARLVKVELANDQWSVQTVWSAPVLKTKFSNVLVRDGYAYGIDDIVLQCVDIETGKSVWKKRRRPPFGHGQNMLVGDHIFIISEEGEGILIEANHAEYVELASLPLITSEGITWNNPAIAGDLLLVRNDREAAAYRLPRQPLQ
jgi:outer membrane protein assembly factor BamB